MRWVWSVGVVVGLFAAVQLFQFRNQSSTPTVISGSAMGTRYHIKIADALPVEARIEDDIESLVDEIEDEASQWRESSWVSHFNSENSLAPIRAPDHVWAILLVAKEVYNKSGGLLDVTIGPLVESWGFGHQPHSDPPAPHDLEKLRAVCGFDKLVLDGRQQTIKRKVPGLRIDLSALAKGYAVDQIDAHLKGLGLGNYVIEFGGEVMARGYKSCSNEHRDSWRIALPGYDGKRQILGINNLAYATSGGSEQNRKVGGNSVTHLIDPRTGRPTRDITGAVTVGADRCVVADAWATALCVASKEEARHLAEHAEVELMDWRD